MDASHGIAFVLYPCATYTMHEASACTPSTGLHTADWLYSCNVYNLVEDLDVDLQLMVRDELDPANIAGLVEAMYQSSLSMFLFENELLARTKDDAPAASLFRAPPGDIRLFGCLRKLHATIRSPCAGSIRESTHCSRA